MKKASCLLFSALMISVILSGCASKEEKLYEQAEELYLAGEYLSAAEIYADLASASYEDAATKENLCYMSLGNADLESGNWESAIEYYELLDSDWEVEGVNRESLIDICEREQIKESVPKLFDTYLPIEGYGILKNTVFDYLEIKDISFDGIVTATGSDLVTMTFHSSELDNYSDSEKISVFWYTKWEAERICREASFEINCTPIIQTDGHTYTAILNQGQEDALLCDDVEIFRERSQAILDTPVSPGGSGGCSLCNGTGSVKYYSSGSDLESILSGYDPYTFGPCSRCGGTGKE